MKISRFIRRSLVYYKQQYMAIVLATMIAVAVLVGSLLIGDSVRYSLKKLVDLRLGKVTLALFTNDRVLTLSTIEKLSQESGVHCHPLIVAGGIAINPENEQRANKVQVFGYKPAFWDLSLKRPKKTIEDEGFMISHELASRLSLTIGDYLIMRIGKNGKISLNMPFSRDDDQMFVLRKPVSYILSDEEFARLSLQNNQQSPDNVFIPYDQLAEKMNLSGYANLVLIADDQLWSIDDWASKLKACMTLEDLGIFLRQGNQHNQYVLTERIFFDPVVEKVISGVQGIQDQVLTYLVNEFTHAGYYTPYSFVSAISGKAMNHDLQKDEMIVNDWLANDLHLAEGDTVEISYYVVGPLKRLKEEKSKFRIVRIIPTRNKMVSSYLMPDFPGLSDAGSCRDWNAGVPVDFSRIREKDERYWEELRGTPKAIISLHAGKKMWNNPFGEITSFRFDEKDLSKEALEKEILSEVLPNKLGLEFKQVRSEGINASQTGVDFSSLFVSLSFFVILAGIILLMVIYGLSAEKRAYEAGILQALGFDRGKVLKIYLSEISVVLVLGTILGIGLGIGYNQFMIKALNTLWTGAVHTHMLQPSIQWQSIVSGGAVGILITWLIILVIMIRKFKMPLSRLIRSEWAGKKIHPLKQRSGMSWLFIGLAGFVFWLIDGIFISSFSSPLVFMFAGAFLLLAGFGLLKKGLLFFSGMNFRHWGAGTLAVKNINRNSSRSIAVIMLLAVGIFTILITGANRKTFISSRNINSSGTGGYEWWIETTLPVIADLNTKAGREKMNLDAAFIDSIKLVQMKKLEGDDASCLNLNKVIHPAILGIDPQIFIDRNAFSFATTFKNTVDDVSWQMLSKEYVGNIIPAIVDQTVLTWGLMKKVGDTLHYQAEDGTPVNLLIVGGLKNSVFQGNIIVDQRYFRKYWPSVAGSSVMLIEGENIPADRVQQYLTKKLIDYGIEIQQAPERLKQFNTVNNTYLDVFMMLSGLSMLIGLVGFGLVLIRNMQDRKSELAIMKALGFSNRTLFIAIFQEHFIMLVCGFVLGGLAAITGMLPSFLSREFDVPGLYLISLVSIIFLSGVISIFISVFSALSGQILQNLRKE